MKITNTKIPSYWSDILGEIIARPRPPLATTTPLGAVLLGKGFTSNVWKINEFAVKLFRHRHGLNVPEGMHRELTTYERLSYSTQPSGLPQLFDHGLLDEPAIEPNACGWAQYSLVQGRPLSFDELTSLNEEKRDRWIHDVVLEAINIETSLSQVEPPQNWHNDYASVQFDRIRKLADTPGRITPEQLELAANLHSLISELTVARKFIHGDFNPPNVIANLDDFTSSTSIIKFVDPLINLDAPEANWRHFTAIPLLSDTLLTEYEQQTGAVLKSKVDVCYWRNDPSLHGDS